MKCYDPVLCYIDQNGKKIFRHFSHASTYIRTAKPNMVLNCGKCLICRKKRAYELACKCVLHSSLYLDNCFLTLTYDEKQKDYTNEMQYSHVQDFKKNLRTYAFRELGRRIDIFNVHEYGKNRKKHWHLIVFNWTSQVKRTVPSKGEHPLYSALELHKMWPYGHHSLGSVSEATAMYQAQYMEKDFKHSHIGTKYKSHSKHSGIGKPYFLKYYKQILSLGYVPIGGKKLPLPRSFEKIAHRHYCHFYELSAFSDNLTRKALHRPFTKETPNQEIADLYVHFKNIKHEKIKELEKEFEGVISQHLTTKDEPDFIKAHANTLHDLLNRLTPERF